MSHIYRNLWLILFAFLLAGCSTTTQKSVVLNQALDIQKRAQIPAADQDIRSMPAPSTKKATRLPPFETLVYKVRYLGLSVATLTASIKGTTFYKGREVYVFELIGRSNAFWSKIFKIEDRYLAYMDVERLHALRHEEYRREGRYKRDAIVEYDQHQNIAHYKHLLNGEKKSFAIPKEVHDSLSSVYYFRMHPLNVGDTIDYDVNINEKNYDLFGVIEKRTKIRLKGFGRVEALVMQPYIELNGKMVKKGKLKGYFSADEKHIPLKAIIKTPVFGKATVQLYTVNGQKRL